MFGKLCSCDPCFLRLHGSLFDKLFDPVRRPKPLSEITQLNVSLLFCWFVYRCFLCWSQSAIQWPCWTSFICTKSLTWNSASSFLQTFASKFAQKVKKTQHPSSFLYSFKPGWWFGLSVSVLHVKKKIQLFTSQLVYGVVGQPQGVVSSATHSILASFSAH